MALLEKDKYIKNDMFCTKPKIFEAVTQEQDFETWFSQLDPKKQDLIEVKFSLLNKFLIKKLYNKEIITPIEGEKIVKHIAHQAYKITSDSENPQNKKDNQVYNGLKISAQEILDLYNQFVAQSWIQKAYASNYDFESLVNEIGTKYNKKAIELEVLSKIENFVPDLINFGLYAGVNTQKSTKEKIHSSLSRLFGKEGVNKAFVDAKRKSAESKKDVFWQMVNLVTKNHPKKLAGIAALTFFGSVANTASLNNLVNSLNEKDLDSAIISALILVLADCGAVLSLYLREKIDIWMDNGSVEGGHEFDGLGAFLIGIIEKDPFFAQIYANNTKPEELKNFINEIKLQYFGIYNLVFKEGLDAVFSILGSIFTAVKLMDNSPATIIPPLVAIILNYIFQEIKNQKSLPLESARIEISAKIETLFLSKVTEIGDRLGIRDTKNIFKVIMPEIALLKEKLLNLTYLAYIVKRVDSSAPAYALMSILGMKSDNSILQSLFGGDPKKVFGMSMVQTSIANNMTKVFNVSQRLQFNLDVINYNFLRRLYTPDLKFNEIPDSSIVLDDLIMFKNMSKSPIKARIAQGGIVQISGNNGSGKSSLLNLISNQTPIQAYIGEIMIGGVPIYLIDPVKYQQIIVKMPQDVQVFNDTIGVNICGSNDLNPYIYNLFVDSPLAKNLYKQYSKQTPGDIDYLSLPEWWKENIKQHKIDKLSGGEKKILGILRVIAKLLQNPGVAQVVLLDELMANLSFKNDSNTQTEIEEESIHDWMQKVVLDMMKENPNTTFIFIDHSSDRENSLPSQIKAETNLSKRLEGLRLA